MALSQCKRLVALVVTRQSISTLKTNKRLYGRWINRNPSKVIMPFKNTTLKTEKIIDLDPNSLNKARENHLEKVKKTKSSIESKKSINDLSASIEDGKQSHIPTEKSTEIKEKRILRNKVRLENMNKENVFDENNQIIYEKLKDNDGRISTLLINLKSKKGRARSGTVLVEGWRLIVDGLQAKCPLRYIIFSNKEDLSNIRPFLPKTGVKVYKIPYKEIQLWSDVDTSPGILGIFEKPSTENFVRCQNPLPINIICDNIRVPGNLGAILRAGVGVGCDKILLMKGCVDLWDPKVIRSAAGAHFHLPVHSGVEWEQISHLLDANTSLFVADNNSKEVLDYINDSEIHNKVEGFHIPVLPYYSIEYATMNSITIVVGGETEGISEDCYRFIATRNGIRINIPLQKGIDSLNTGMAVAVIVFEVKKQLLEAKGRNKDLVAHSI